MLVVIAYDVSTDSAGGAKRLRRVARLCENHGARVQFSVFECKLDWAQWITLKAQLIAQIDPEVDSLRFYLLGNNWEKRVEHIGAKKSYNPESALILWARSPSAQKSALRQTHVEPSSCEENSSYVP